MSISTVKKATENHSRKLYIAISPDKSIAVVYQRAKKDGIIWYGENS
jgi:hypothetical protein